uniref:ABC transporter domain-containing protein n=1 Tax=Timema monikensis TaxID=170555 RepID=A0A7R9EIP4_9NEOP|nr:unnamed protein product [Timema monikensis]
MLANYATEAEEKQILRGVSGEFRAGELTAIMGPSGAGKSTLLNVMAGYKCKGTGGQILVNGRDRNKRSLDEFSRLSCYIMQDDHLREVLTARESMSIASSLKLGRSTGSIGERGSGERQNSSKEREALTEQWQGERGSGERQNSGKEREAQVRERTVARREKERQNSSKRREAQIEELLEMLGLTECQKTRCAQLSGGQKKRLSIALELISNPPVLFLDEPTTGLDSSSCSQCVALLKQLAQDGRTVICTIHQPSAKIFEMFDHLYTLSEGRCVYQGSIVELMPFLEGFGLQCPPYHNPADFLLEAATGEFGTEVSTLALAAESLKRTEERSTILRSQYNLAKEKQKDPTQNNGAVVDEGEDVAISINKPASVWDQFLIIYLRNLVIMRRDYSNVTVRVLAHLLIGLLFGYLYKGVGNNGNTVLANYVYIYGSTLFLVYTGKMSVMLMFPLEFQMLTREHFNRWYSLPPYLLSVILIEAPIQVISSLMYLVISYLLTDQIMEPQRMGLFIMLGVTVSLTAQGAGFLVGVTTPIKIAVFLGPMLACLLSMFGFNIFFRDTPYLLRWLFHISYFRAAFQGSVFAMYGLNRTNLECDILYCHMKLPSKILQTLDMEDVDIWGNMEMLVGMWCLIHLTTIVAIWFRLNRR